MARTLVASGDYRVLRRFRKRSAYAAPTPIDAKLGLIIDVETTGLDIEADAIIEFAALPFRFLNDRVYEVGTAVGGFQDPGRPIPPEVTRLTGITDEMVQGHALDLAAIETLAREAVICIAHNARFDRSIVERYLPGFDAIPWACSHAEIDWTNFGCRGSKLDYLLLWRSGEWTDAHHRAVEDCHAALHVLAEATPHGQTPFAALLASARQPTVQLWAVGAPYDRREVLKTRGYRWNDGTNGKPRAWYREIRRDALLVEQEWLVASMFDGRSPDRWITELFTARSRYASRATGSAPRRVP